MNNDDSYNNFHLSNNQCQEKIIDNIANFDDELKNDIKLTVIEKLYLFNT